MSRIIISADRLKTALDEIISKDAKAYEDLNSGEIAQIQKRFNSVCELLRRDVADEELRAAHGLPSGD